MHAVAFLLLVIAVGAAHGQVVDTSKMLPALIKNSTVRNLALADSFSEAGDSINASHYFLKTDPFFFVSSYYTNETIDSAFSGLLLTQQARAEYRRLYATAYNRERTAAWRTFKNMLAEDQAIRHKLSNSTDSMSRSMYERQMTLTDSPHFEYLYNYVKENGWPTYENGAMYADIIALHDGKHMQYYLPHIRRAVIAGASNPAFYSHILNRAKPSDLKRLEGERNKLRFDISHVLKGKAATAAQTEEMQRAVRRCGQVKHVYFVYEAMNKNAYTDFMGMTHNQHYWLAWDMLVGIERADGRSSGANTNKPYDFLYAETNNKQERLTVFIVY